MTVGKITLALFVAATLGCKSQSESGSLLRSDAPAAPVARTAPPVLVLVGGNASCADAPASFSTGLTGHIAARGTSGMSMEANFNAFRAALQQTVRTARGDNAITLPFYKSCFRFIQDGRTVVYQTSASGSDATTTAAGAEAGEAIPVGSYDAWMRPLVDAINGLAGTGADARPIVIVGHSFGGWLSMQLATRLPAGSVKALVTLDPISRANCLPNAYRASTTRLAQALGPERERLGGRSPSDEFQERAAQTAAEAGCSQFPADVNGAAVAAAAGDGGWRSYYQDYDHLLHSGQAANASNETQKVEFTRDEVRTNRANMFVPAHSAISRHAATWAAIQTHVVERLGLDRAPPGAPAPAPSSAPSGMELTNGGYDSNAGYEPPPESATPPSEGYMNL